MVDDGLEEVTGAAAATPAPGMEGGHDAPMFDPDDVLSETEFRKTLRGDRLPVDGDYIMKIAKHRYLDPNQMKDGKAGGDEVTFEPVQGPTGVEPPKDGYAKPRRLFRKFRASDLGETKNRDMQARDKTDKANLIAACGIDPTGGINMSQALFQLAQAGATVLVEVSGTDGEFQNIRNFRFVNTGLKPGQKAK